MCKLLGAWSKLMRPALHTGYYWLFTCFLQYDVTVIKVVNRIHI